MLTRYSFLRQPHTRQQLVKPLFDHGLAIAASDSNDWYVEFIAMTFCQPLQGSQRTDYLQKISLCITFLYMQRNSLDYKIADSTSIQVVDVFMSVVPLGLHGKKQCFFREAQRTAIGEQPSNHRIRIAIASSANERCNFFYRISHVSFLIWCEITIFSPINKIFWPFVSATHTKTRMHRFFTNPLV